MTIVWPEAMPKLRAEREHWSRRLDRIEAVATDGGRIDWTEFPEWRAYVQGKADAWDEVFEILDAMKPTGALPLDMAVVLLAQNGVVDPEVIAARCGVTVLDVAATLARYAAAGGIETGGTT